MNSEWQLQTAKNKFSQVLDMAMHQGPQTITRHGKPAVIVLSMEDYRRITGVGKLAEFFARSPLKNESLNAERDQDTGSSGELAP